MDIIKSWRKLNDRMKEQAPELIGPLMMIHLGAFDDLRNSGHMLGLDGKRISHIVPTLSAEQRLELAGKIGQSLITAEESLFEKAYVIENADGFPNCIFIALAAMLENTNAAYKDLPPGKKIKITCSYDTLQDQPGPLGRILPVLTQCFPWLDMTAVFNEARKPAAEKPQWISLSDSKSLFCADGLTKIDTMRTVFSGRVTRGTLRKNDILNVTDHLGKVLCNEGVLLSMFIGNKEVDTAAEGQRIDELCLSVDIPKGEYRAIFVAGNAPPSIQAIKSQKLNVSGMSSESVYIRCIRTISDCLRSLGFSIGSFGARYDAFDPHVGSMGTVDLKYGSWNELNSRAEKDADEKMDVDEVAILEHLCVEAERDGDMVEGIIDVGSWNNETTACLRGTDRTGRLENSWGAIVAAVQRAIDEAN